MRKTLYDYCIENNRIDLLEEWDSEKNAGLSMTDVTFGSHKSVWWRCKLGHSWQAAGKSRIIGYDCPFCKHRKVLVGFNDLGTTDPSLAGQWHPTKNYPLQPTDVFAGSTKKVFWSCGYGHTWEAAIASRVKGSGCPVCAGKVVVKGINDLASAFPHIAAQWNFEQNGPLLPDHVTPFSNRKVWWRCELGHDYPAVISSRTSDGTGCPYCSGRRVLTGFNDLRTRYPLIAAQWHEKLNGSLTPDLVTSGSKKKVWWKCSAGHIWKAVIYSRTGSYAGCPVCSDVKSSPYYYTDPAALEKRLLSSLEFDI